MTTKKAGRSRRPGPRPKTLSVEDETRVAEVLADAGEQLLVGKENKDLLWAMERLLEAYEIIGSIPPQRVRRKGADQRAVQTPAVEILALERLEQAGVAYHEGNKASPLSLDLPTDALLFSKGRDRLLRSSRCLLRFVHEILRAEIVRGSEVEGAPQPFEDLSSIQARLLRERLGLGDSQVAVVLAPKKAQLNHRGKARTESRRQKVIRDKAIYRKITAPVRAEFVKGLEAAGVSEADVGEKTVSAIVHKALVAASAHPLLASEVAALYPRRRSKR